MKVLWQHKDGDLYAVEHDTFGHVIGATGPLDWDDPHDPSEYCCEAENADWVEDAIRHHALHRVHPAVLQQPLGSSTSRPPVTARF